MGWWVYSNIQQNIQLAPVTLNIQKLSGFIISLVFLRSPLLEILQRKIKLIIVEDCAHVLSKF